MPIGRPEFNNPEFNNNDAKITFVGHSTTLVEMSGVRVLTDPIFRDKFRLLRRRSRVCQRG